MRLTRLRNRASQCYRACCGVNGAVEVNIAIMRTFVQLRRLMDTNRDLARKIEALEKKYDEHFAVVFEAIKQLIAPPAPAKKQIGFHP